MIINQCQYFHGYLSNILPTKLISKIKTSIISTTYNHRIANVLTLYRYFYNLARQDAFDVEESLSEPK